MALHPAALCSVSNMSITPSPVVMFLLVLSVPALCGKREPPTLQPDPPPETWPGFTRLDDVRLLANDLLQLGQSMREFAQRTKGQIHSIFQKLSLFQRSFTQLSVLTREIREEEEELKKTTVALKTDNDAIKELSGRISSKIESLLQERSRQQNKVDGLEEEVSRVSLGLQAAEVSSLRVSDPSSDISS